MLIWPLALSGFAVANIQAPPRLDNSNTRTDAFMFGSVLAKSADYNGDGRGDILVGDPGPAGVDSGSSVWVISGADGKQCSVRYSSAYQAGRGIALASGADIDGDGTEDWMFGCGFDQSKSKGSVILVSGKSNKDVLITGAPAASGEFGRRIGFLGKAANWKSPGLFALSRNLKSQDYEILVLSSSGGDLQGQYETGPGLDPDSVSAVGDYDQDGALDIAYAVVDRIQKHEAIVRVISSGNGKLLTETRWVDRLADNGIAIRKCGDLDGDHYSEYVIGLYGQVELFSGKSGGRLKKLLGQHGEGFGYDVGVAEQIGEGERGWHIVAASPDWGVSQGRVSCFSSSGESPLWHAVGEDDVFHFGFALTVLNDVNGDGIPDLAVGGRGDVAHVPGRVSVLSGIDGRCLYRLKAASGQVVCQTKDTSNKR